MFTDHEFHFFQDDKGSWRYSMWAPKRAEEAAAEKMMIIAPTTFGPFGSERDARISAMEKQYPHTKKLSLYENLLQHKKWIVPLIVIGGYFVC